jgi:D-3-phosphoglycerate dehydrogenase
MADERYSEGEHTDYLCNVWAKKRFFRPLSKTYAHMKALITDTAHPLLQEGLEKRGYACDYRPEITDAEVRGAIAPYTGLVVNSKIWVDRELLDRAPRLQWVMRLGSGLEIIDLSYAAERGVAVFSSPEGNCDAVAEHALGMLLSLANHCCRADREVRQRVWAREQNRGFELMGKTIGIWGFGHTGSALARKLAGFGTTVLAYDKYLPAGYASAMPQVEEATPERIFAEAEVLSLHLPLTPETRHLVDAGLWWTRRPSWPPSRAAICAEPVWTCSKTKSPQPILPKKKSCTIGSLRSKIPS